MANKYKVMHGDRQVFFALEGTGLCFRQCQGGCCCWFPAWNTQLRVLNNQGSAEEAFYLQRPQSFTCCCFGRPRVIVGDVRNAQEIARVTDPCTVCWLTFNVFDANDDPVLNINAAPCQCGLCCPCPCGPCAQVEFLVEDVKSGSQVGRLVKKVPGILSWLASPDVDNYEIEFSAIQDPKLKIALLAAAIFIDFRLFNDNSNDDSRRDAFDQLTGGDTTEE